MTYAKQTWADGSGGGTPITAARLSYMEDGIETAAAGTAPTLSNIPAGSVLYVNQNGDGTWPNRLTSRTDVKQIWTKIVAASADPASATSPAVNGAYAYDVVVGV